MKLEPTWHEIGEEIRRLDAHRAPVLTTEHLLRAPAPVARSTAPRRPRTLTYVRLVSAAAVLAAVALLWQLGQARRQPVAGPVTSGPQQTDPGASSTAPIPEEPLASWSFDAAASGSIPADAGTATLDVRDGVTSVPGLTGSALSFTGVWPSDVETSTPVVDTSASFTISTFINAGPLRDCLYQSFVSQDGTVVSGFELGMDPACTADAPGFMFAMYDADADSATQHRLTSPTTVTPGRWYHVVAVHDAEAGEMRLYVDGNLETIGPAPITPWVSDGPFAVGRARFSSQDRDFFAGSIDTTTVYQRVLTDEEIAAL